MAHQWIRGNLAAAFFPLVTDLWGRSVVVPQYDENYERVIVSPVDQGKDKGVPQIYYCHNVLATSNGFQAVSYNKLVNGVGGATGFNKAFALEDINLNRALLASTVTGCYALDNGALTWQAIAGAPTSQPGSLVTTGFVQGQTYVCFQNLGVYQYFESTNTLQMCDTPGLETAAIIGICSANGYLIAYTLNAVAWSSQSNPLNFVPSLITGAGGGQVNDAKGAIIAGLPISGGFVIYCENNSVGATYTGNSEVPFTILEIPSSGGISVPERVSWAGNSNSATHYAWTNNGLQAITLGSPAQLIFGEVVEFLAGQIYEDFNEETLQFTQTQLMTQLNVKLAMIANQYLVISYGISGNTPPYTYALVYDQLRQRWGKLKIPHVAAFQWNAPGNNTDFTYGALTETYAGLAGTSYGQLAQVSTGAEELVDKTICFLQADGTIYQVSRNFSEPNGDGVIMFGKYQLQRNNMVTLQRVTIDGIEITNTCNVYAVITLDGKTLQVPVAMTLITQGQRTRNYGKRITGVNVSLLLIGSFNLSSYQLDLTVSGRSDV